MDIAELGLVATEAAPETTVRLSRPDDLAHSAPETIVSIVRSKTGCIKKPRSDASRPDALPHSVLETTVSSVSIDLDRFTVTASALDVRLDLVAYDTLMRAVKLASAPL